MVNLNHLPRAKDISLTEPVTITLPAYVWQGFIASYASTKWACGYTSAIALAVREQLLDPVWLKENEASHQLEHDLHQEIIRRMVTGQGPDLPPNMTDPP